MERESTTEDALWAALVENGVLGADQVAALRTSVDIVLPRQLGKILLDEGMVTMRELMEIVGNQLDRPDLRLGELAVAAGYCTEAQVKRCLKIQESESAHAVDVLLDGGDRRMVGIIRSLFQHIRMLEAKMDCAGCGNFSCPPAVVAG